MWSRTFGTLSLFFSLGYAFQDTSPFFLYSTSPIFQKEKTFVATASSTTKSLRSHLLNCPSDSYILVSQPGAPAQAYADGDSVPHLRAKLSGSEEKIRSQITIDSLLGDVDIRSISRMLQESCGLEQVNIDASDAFLASVIDHLAGPEYTVIYTTSPDLFPDREPFTEHTPYEMDMSFGDPIHMELKRDLSHHKRASTNITLPDAPLFERYQFFGDGLFMGIIVGLLLLSILYVAISGVAGLQVSYAAFDKEMGPAAQKKQQQ